jgi:hypothetical protein
MEMIIKRRTYSNSLGTLSATGKPFTKDMIEWIRFKHKIDRPLIRAEHEFTVAETMKMFKVSKIHGLLLGRKEICSDQETQKQYPASNTHNQSRGTAQDDR